MSRNGSTGSSFGICNCWSLSVASIASVNSGSLTIAIFNSSPLPLSGSPLPVDLLSWEDKYEASRLLVQRTLHEYKLSSASALFDQTSQNYVRNKGTKVFAAGWAVVSFHPRF